MAPLPFRFRRRAPTADGVQPAAPRRPPPPAAQVRRERRALLRLREERMRDLGGVVLEMYRQESFRDDLVYERCADIVSLDERLLELDSLLNASSRPRRVSRGARCECGAPIVWGTHFCANCGRAVGDVAGLTCVNCGGAMPAEARFCGSCGHPVEPTQPPEPAPALPEP
ncbi:MAG TPA: zinc ribbon domain-containing protein [Gaiellaceae bacterium]